MFGWPFKKQKQAPRYVIEIYVYNGRLVFTGMLDLYFERYKGIGPGIYDKPILCLEQNCSTLEIKNGLDRCLETLLAEREYIFRTNTQKLFTEMEKSLFQNFKLVGIRDSKRKIQNGATLIQIRKRDKTDISKAIEDQIQETIHLPMNASH